MENRGAACEEIFLLAMHMLIDLIFLHSIEYSRWHWRGFFKKLFKISDNSPFGSELWMKKKSDLMDKNI